MTSQIEVGTKVQVNAQGHSVWAAYAWFPKGEVTGTATKVFKNGNIAVAIDQLPNSSKDGKQTLHFKETSLDAI